ncbi:general transcription factor II-I repeat domain-containing protein 2-like [Bactrocera dorsalis]|uniref:General transcription factor II-I repeat domain-containing protein 2-like n=1 Tax=Bactrocera dorsalis TaxID=27457 RepID=A0ABM3JN34_BACDO|nr:general transcription factor II-I repeat domain-containing protein 2-like [Bactrocera dorsalis]
MLSAGESSAQNLKRKMNPFNVEWAEKYLCQESSGSIQCLLCKKHVPMKKYNIQRHYEAQHDEYDRYTGESRTNFFMNLKSLGNIKAQECSVDSNGAIYVSYAIALKMVLGNHPFSYGDFIKECILEAAGTLTKEHLPKYQKICLSRRTIAQRVQDMASDSERQLKNRISTFTSVSLALDESTDVNDIAQLAVFIRGTDIDFNITEELLDIIPMKGTTTGEDIFNAVMNCAVDKGLDWSKVHSVATDGAKSMTDHKSGFIGRLRSKFSLEKYNDFIAVHCLVHQQALCAKSLAFAHVMDVFVKCVNLVRSHDLNHRQFKEFLESMECDYGDIPYYTETRWLSRGKTLSRFYDLRLSISNFLVMFCVHRKRIYII